MQVLSALGLKYNFFIASPCEKQSHMERWTEKKKASNRQLDVAWLNSFRQPHSSVAHLLCLHCLIV